MKILHLENNRLDADLIRATLTSQGIVANIDAVESETEFQASLLNGKFDLVLSDYSLPGFNGSTALQIVREFNQELPFIFVSGTIGEEIAVESLKNGATDYVLKEGLQRLGPSVLRALREVKEREKKSREDEALHVTNQTLQAVVQASPLAIVARDIERKVTLWNPAAERFFGWTESEAVGQVLPTIPEEDLQGQSALRDLFLSSEGLPAACNLETRRLRKDGSIIQVSISYAPLRDTQDSIIGSIRIFADITERKLAADRFRLVVEAAPGPMLMVSDAGLIILVNEQAEHLFGYKRAELLNQPAVMLVPERYRFQHPDHRTLFSEHPTTQSLGAGRDLYGLRKDGSEVPIEIGLNPISTAEGSFVLASIVDITKRKHAEEVLRTSEIRYRRLFESAKDGILILDADSGQIVDVNPFLLEMLDFSREEFIGKELWEIGLFKDVAASRLAFTELQQRGYIRYENLPLETREGLVRPVEFVSNSYLAGENRVIQCNIRDITARQRWEQTLKDKNVELGNANLAKDHFLANMSHELRTPLNAIIGFTGTLLMGLPGSLNADQEHQMSIVQTSARHLLSLINDLLDLSKVESGNVELKYEPVVCREVMEEVAAALRPLAESKGLEFNIKAPKSSVRILSDRRILSQILINLSNNAIKFTEKGEVQIHLRERLLNGQALASIEVIDTGIGISLKDQRELFQAFHQVGSNHRTEGTGLGLYVSQRLAVLIKGKIECVSEYGKGSTFRLLLATA